jgi:hypothetical protein
MRRLLSLVSLVLSLVLLPAPGSPAQEAGEARLALVRQSPWNGPGRPLRLEVRAENRGTETFKELSLSVTISDRVTSRSEYEFSLQGDPTAALNTETSTLRGVLRPAVSREFAVERDVEQILRLAGRHTDGVFPVRVELRSGGITVGVLRTPMVYLAETPENPLLLTWTFVLHHPIDYGANGDFLSGALERTAAPSGALASEVEALSDMVSGDRPRPVDVVISPPLLDQLHRMQDGYTVAIGDEVRTVSAGEGGAADAGRLLRQLQTVASGPTVEVSALPFAAPSIPALVEANLQSHLRIQMERGRQAVQGLVGTEIPGEILYPPGSTIDQASLFRLRARGIRLLLLDAGRVEPRPQDRGFAPPALTLVHAGLSRTITAIVPDEGISLLLASPLLEADPRLGAQAILGELAAIWMEQPGTLRGLAMLLSENVPLPAGFFPGLVERVVQAPWLRPVKATTMAGLVPPAEEPVSLLPSIISTFSPSYVDGLREARQLITTYRSMLLEDDPLPARLETLTLLAEAAQFTEVESRGTSFIEHVHRRLEQEFAKVRPDTEDQVVTLTSKTGIIPVAIESTAERPLRVTVRLSSPRLRFVRGSSQEIELTDAGQTLTFQVQAQTTGRFPVQVRIETRDGYVLSEGELVVRSTAYNRIALIITIGAALFLLGRWARRFLPRAKT